MKVSKPDNRFNLTRGQIDHYNNSRNKANRFTFCKAPLNNMYFSWEGKVIACCFNQTHVLGSYPEMSIKQIWRSEKTKELRESLAQFDLSKGCDSCYQYINNQSYQSVNSLRFDDYLNTDYPAMMEFQLTNTCNLECVMCDGFLSSSIRANREHLPSIPNKYDSDFVKQLIEFIPYLKFTNFSGGEPFLIKLYFDIWNEISIHNPNCDVKIITNGTIYNDRVKSMLNRNKVHITISIDSINKLNYEKIRVGANFDSVMENAQKFNEYCRERNTIFNLNFCPMISNWQEIPDFINFCNSMGVTFYFSIVNHPYKLSLQSLPVRTLEQIKLQLSKYKFPNNSRNEIANQAEFDNFINVLNSFIKNSYNGLDSNIGPTEVLHRIFEKILDFESSGFNIPIDIKSKIEQAIMENDHAMINYQAFYHAVQNMTYSSIELYSKLNVAEIREIINNKYAA